MEIELLKPQDLEAYKQLIDECFGSSNDLSLYKQYCENQNYKIFVIKEGGKTIAEASAYRKTRIHTTAAHFVLWTARFLPSAFFCSLPLFLRRGHNANKKTAACHKAPVPFPANFLKTDS